MAELKKLPRQIFNTKAPSLENFGKTEQVLGEVASAGFKAIGEIVKANNVLEEKTLNTKATTDIERLKIKYQNDPMISMDSIQNFQQESNAIINGYISQSNHAYSKNLQNSLENVTAKYSTELMGTAYKQSIKNDRRDISLALGDLEKQYSENLSSNNFAEASKNKADVDEMLKAYYVRGGTAQEIQKISDSFNIIGVSTPFINELKNSKTEAQRTDVMQKMMSLDNTPVNAAAINIAWKEYSRLNKLYKQATDITGPINNAAAGQSYKNFTLDEDIANESVKYVAKRIANSTTESTDEVRKVENYQVLPSSLAQPEPTQKVVLSPSDEAKFQDWYKKWAKKTSINDNPDDPLHFYDYRAAFLAKAEPMISLNDAKYHWPDAFKSSDNPTKIITSVDSKLGLENSITNGVMKTLEAPQEREPSLYELAQAHALIGAEKSNIFPKEASNRIMSGNGEVALEAANAIDYVFLTNLESLKLDPKTETVYTEFKLMRDSGRTDYDEMIKEAKKSVLKISQSDLKVNTDIFNSSYSMKGKSYENLKKAFNEITGAKYPDTKSLNDFYRTFRAKFLLADGKESTALEMTKREMARIHGSDKFSSTSDDINQSFFRPAGEIAASLIPTTELFLGLKKSNFEYVRFPPSKILSGLTETQIQNQFVEQIVMASERNSNIKIAEHYGNIKNATEADKMNKNFAFPAPDWSAEMGDINASIYITQNIEGVGEVSGRVFFKSNDLTVQNNSGKPVWEVWMQDRSGREFPVIDDNSPYNNTLLVIGQTSDEYVPEWSKERNDADLQNSVDELLTAQGRELYPWIGKDKFSVAGFEFSYPSPTVTGNNFANRRAYKQELANQKLAEQNINRVLKGIPLKQEEQVSMETKNVATETKEESKEEAKPEAKPDVKQEAKKLTPIDAIKKASEQSGIDEKLLEQIAQKESGLNPNAKAKKTKKSNPTASGLFQINKKTWKVLVERYGKQYSITEDMKFDTYANSIMGAMLIKENKQGLKRLLKREPTNKEIYIAHFAGLRKAYELIKAFEKNPNIRVEKIFNEDEIESNKNILKGTVKDVIERLSKGIK